MIVTTAGRTTEKMTLKAKQVAQELHLPFKERRDQSIKKMQKHFETNVFVVGKDKFSIHEIGNEEPLFFHPNSAMFRVKRLLKGDVDPFIHTAKLKSGMTVLDCTLGLASDSIVASVVVGKGGNVTGIEQNRYIAYLVKMGLVQWDSGLPIMNDGMKNIEVITSNHLDYLKSAPDNSYDIVYFDPMFDESIQASDGIRMLRTFASYKPITSEIVLEAKRVAKQRVVMKDHWKSDRFELLGFTVQKRPTALFHFATIEVE